MARIAGVNIPNQKRVPIGLTYIHGIGRTKASEICNRIGIPLERRVHELTDDEVLRVRELIDRDYTVEGDLRRQVAMNIKRLDGSRLLPRTAPSQGASGARAAYAYERTDAQGAGPPDRRQEEIDLRPKR